MKVGTRLSLASLVMAFAPTGPAVGATDEVLATSTDAREDVRLRPGSKLTWREKQSIDVREVELRRIGAKAQVVITVREIDRVRKFDQMFYLTLTERVDAPNGQWVSEAGFTTKGRLSYATYHAVDWSNWHNCDRVTVDVRPAKRQVIATTPRGCTPMDPVRVSLLASTGTFRSDAPVYSVDRHRVAGYYDFAL